MGMMVTFRWLFGYISFLEMVFILLTDVIIIGALFSLCLFGYQLNLIRLGLTTYQYKRKLPSAYGYLSLKDKIHMVMGEDWISSLLFPFKFLREIKKLKTT